MFVLGRKSKRELKGVHPDLKDVVNAAIRITAVDFGVHDGIRTLDEQREYKRRGVSQTLNSKHLPQSDGYGHAVDLVPYINGKLRWEWEPIYEICAAVAEAARVHGVRLRWGAAWHTCLNDAKVFTPNDAKKLMGQYGRLRRSQKRKPFFDGPHFELHKSHF